MTIAIAALVMVMATMISPLRSRTRVCRKASSTASIRRGPASALIRSMTTAPILPSGSAIAFRVAGSFAVIAAMASPTTTPSAIATMIRT